jgi:hypothetical protein
MQSMRECLDHIIVLNEKYLRRILKEYFSYLCLPFIPSPLKSNDLRHADDTLHYEKTLHEFPAFVVQIPTNACS